MNGDSHRPGLEPRPSTRRVRVDRDPFVAGALSAGDSLGSRAHSAGVAFGRHATQEPAGWWGSGWRWDQPGRPPGHIDEIETVNKVPQERRDCYCWDKPLGKFVGLRQELEVSTQVAWMGWERVPGAWYYLDVYNVTYVAELYDVQVFYDVSQRTCKGRGCNPEYTKTIKTGPTDGPKEFVREWRSTVRVKRPVYAGKHGKWHERDLKRRIRAAVLDDIRGLPYGVSVSVDEPEAAGLGVAFDPPTSESEGGEGARARPESQAERKGDSPSRRDLRGGRRPQDAIGDRPIREQTERERSGEQSRRTGASGGRGPGQTSTAPIRIDNPQAPGLRGSPQRSRSGGGGGRRR